MTITIKGREYTVTPHSESQTGIRGEGTTYVITGKRGHKWYTCRNTHTTHAMFLLPEKGFTKTMDGVWLSDKNGTLEVIS